MLHKITLLPYYIIWNFRIFSKNTNKEASHTSTILLLVRSILLSSSLTIDLINAFALFISSGFLLCKSCCNNRDFSSSSKLAGARGLGLGGVGSPR